MHRENKHFILRHTSRIQFGSSEITNWQFFMKVIFPVTPTDPWYQTTGNNISRGILRISVTRRVFWKVESSGKHELVRGKCEFKGDEFHPLEIRMKLGGMKNGQDFPPASVLSKKPLADRKTRACAFPSPSTSNGNDSQLFPTKTRLPALNSSVEYNTISQFRLNRYKFATMLATYTCGRDKGRNTNFQTTTVICSVQKYP